ncbi:hypothetical protein DFS34DRAFT_685212 [Phlyctochytrium arcticum]|nr:hypothetical protein DFS34DRAFT_685212 [Phlyctochytrium arcticum]
MVPRFALVMMVLSVFLFVGGLVSRQKHPTKTPKATSIDAHKFLPTCYTAMAETWMRVSESNPYAPEVDEMDVDVPAEMMDVDGNPPCVWQWQVRWFRLRFHSCLSVPALPLPAGTVEVKGKAEALAKSKLSVFEDDSDDDEEDGRPQSTAATKKSRPAVSATVSSAGPSTIQRPKPLPMRKFRQPQGRSGR